MRHLFLADGSAFSRYWMDVRCRMRARGVVRGLRFAASRARWEDFLSAEHYLLLERPVQDEPITRESEVTLTFRLAAEVDIPLLQHLYEWPSTLHDQARMIREGAVTMFALDGERLVGAVSGTIWGESPDSVKIMGPAIASCFPVVPYEDAYMEALYVLPEYRIKHVATSLLLRLLSALYERGVRRTYCIPLVSNTASIQTLKGIGCRAIGKLTVIQLTALAYVRIRRTGS